jgi:hypothetical protein
MKLRTLVLGLCLIGASSPAFAQDFSMKATPTAMASPSLSICLLNLTYRTGGGTPPFGDNLNNVNPYLSNLSNDVLPKDPGGVGLKTHYLDLGAQNGPLSTCKISALFSIRVTNSIQKTAAGVKNQRAVIVASTHDYLIFAIEGYGANETFVEEYELELIGLPAQ